MNYTFHQLQVFVKVCDTQSVTKASEELYLTQPAVSIQLKKFQEQFRTPLTEVVGRRLYITEFGREIEKTCRTLLEQSKQIEATSLQYEGLLAGKLSVSVVSTGKYIIPYFINEFSHEHPSIDISIDVTNKSKVKEALLNYESEFALVSVLPDDLDVEYEELMTNQLYLVASTDQIFDKVSKKQLEKLKFIFREEGSATRNAMKTYLTKMGVEKPSRLELVSNEAVKQAVCAGLGYSVLPLIGMKLELALDKLKIVEAPGLPLETKWRLIYLKGKKLSPVGNAFIQYLRESKSQVVSDYFS